MSVVNATLTDDRKLALGEVDYLVIGMMFMVSSGIGLYFRFSGGKQKTTQEFLLAGRDMAILPVAMSIVATGKSAITYLGIASDMYIYGTHYAFVNFGTIAGSLVASYLFVPVFFKAGVSTSYEYLEKRYGRTLRLMCSISFSLQSILYMGVILYAPALALSAVTSLSVWMSVVAVGLVCTFYCTLGGMKAVLWTDFFQAFLMYGSLLAMVVKGSSDVGGLETVIQRSMDGGRLVVPGLEMDFTTRYTLTNVFLNGFFVALSAYGTGQVQVQRLLTVRSAGRARCALLTSIPLTSLFMALNCFTGLVIYANYYKCDPLTAKDSIISKPDQLLPYFSLTSLGHIPGIPGLCVCGMLSAALSTMSSVVNSLTTVTVEDFVRPIFIKRHMSEASLAILAKFITLFYSAIGLLLSFVVARFGNVLQASSIVYGLIAGPTVGIFLLGVLTTRTNEKGTIVGLVISLVFTAWISFGGAYTNIHHPQLPVSTDGCPSNNASLTLLSNVPFHLNHTAVESATQPFQTNMSSQTSAHIHERYIFPLYKISYMWFSTIGVAVAVVFGYFCSFLFCDTIVPDTRLVNSCMAKLSHIKEPSESVKMELVSPAAKKIENGLISQ